LISRSTSILRSGGEWNFHICPFSGKPVFEGFISFLTTARGGNPIDQGLMSVTVSSQNSGDAKNVAAFGDNSYFYSQNQPNQWLCYDFKDLRPSVTHYVIRSNGSQGYYHLRSWVLEGSDDNSTWTELDHRENDTGMNDAYSVSWFEVRSVIECHFIRLRATGPMSSGHNYLFICGFEVFGGLRVPKSLKLT
jgi:hypothetical protein